jgi:hypothetical protein
LYAFLIAFHPCYMPRPSHLPSVDRISIIWWSVRVMKFLVIQSSPFLRFRSKYFQHPVLIHPQFVLFPSCEWASFTPVSNKRQNSLSNKV